MTHPENAEFPQGGWIITLFALVCYVTITAAIFIGTVLFAWPVMGVLKLSQWSEKRAGL